MILKITYIQWKPTLKTLNFSPRSSKSFELKCNRRYEPRNKKKGRTLPPLFSLFDLCA